jgi:hypothetical protein
MADIIDLSGKRTNSTEPEPKKPDAHRYLFEYLSGESFEIEGYLSLGMPFTAILDEDDFVDFVVLTEQLKSITNLDKIKWGDEQPKPQV